MAASAEFAAKIAFHGDVLGYICLTTTGKSPTCRSYAVKTPGRLPQRSKLTLM